MTLLIAGYEFRKSMKYSFIGRDEGAHERQAELDNVPGSIFMVADSAITNGRKTMLNDFRKIYPMPVRLWQPYFVDGFFREYLRVCLDFEIAVGFAGNTLTAQHCLNGLTAHLANLHISFMHPRAGELEMTVLMECEDNPLHRLGFSRIEDEFEPQKYSQLLVADKVAHIVLHSLEKSMESARKYKWDEEAFKTLQTPFVVGIQCPVTRDYVIYVYRMEFVQVEGVKQVRVNMVKLPHGEVAVLGMEAEFGQSAQEAYNAAIKDRLPQQQAMFDFLCTSINTVVDRGDKGIARPAIGKKLESFRLIKTLRKV